jgi:hypothetical protein
MASKFFTRALLLTFLGQWWFYIFSIYCGVFYWAKSLIRLMSRESPHGDGDYRQSKEAFDNIKNYSSTILISHDAPGAIFLFNGNIFRTSAIIQRPVNVTINVPINSTT